MKFFYNIVALMFLVACSPSHPDVPVNYVSCDTLPRLYPDYADVTLPPNIAPVNFCVDEEDIDAVVAKLVYPGGYQTFGDKNIVQFDIESWRDILKSSIGHSISVELYVNRQGSWTRYRDFRWNVVADSIDPYIAYRLLPPTYQTFNKFCIRQRDITSFDEVDIYNNQMLDTPTSGHCINCHSFQNYRTDRMQMHVRVEHGGTVIYDNGKLSKVNLKTPKTVNAGVYPSWHPTLPLIAYSVNSTFQRFHTDALAKIEVYDKDGDLTLYDVENNKLYVIESGKNHLIAYPSWSPDGKFLYYSVSEVTYETGTYDQVRYDIVRRSFDSSAMSFSEPEIVLAASDSVQSATHPRISPDGKWLLTSIGSYGCFHLNHNESDLYLTDMQTMNTVNLGEANSPNSPESYHSWSSSGRWILFSSRRNDNNITKLYFTHVDEDGTSTKAFELPQLNPEAEFGNIYSYNVPEFQVEPVKTTAVEIAKVVQRDAKSVNY